MTTSQRSPNVAEQKQRARTYRKKVLTSSMLGLGLESMDIMFVAFALSSIIATFGLSQSEGGFIFTITNLGMLVGGIVFGLLADRYGRVRVFTYTILLFAFATAMIAFAPSIEWVYFFRFLAGVGGGGEFGIGMAMVADVFTRQTRGRVSALISIGGQLGAASAAILAAIIIPRLGWQALFLVGILPVALVFYVRRHLSETPKWLKQQKREQRVSIKELVNTPHRAMTTVALTIMASVQVAGYFGLMNWLPSILQKQLNLSVQNSSLWMISTIAGMCLGMICFGRMMDRMGAKASYTIFLLVSAVSIYIYIYATNEVLLLIGGAAVGFFVNGMSAGYGALISNRFPSHICSTANNVIFNTGRAIGGFSPMFIGYLMQHYTLLTAMQFLTVLYLISLTMLWLMPKPR